VKKPTETGKYSRRTFLTNSLAGLGGLGVVGAISPHTLAETRIDVAQTVDAPSGDIIYRTLGRTGLKLPIVSMGVMNAFNAEVVEESYKRGVRMFDTAWYYQGGRNEQMVGDVINKLGVRDDVIIGTKILLSGFRLDPERAKSMFLQRFDQSLQRLQTDYVDILYLHDVQNVEQITNPGVIEAFAQLKAQKKIRFAGVSSHKNMMVILEEMMTSDFWDVALVPFNFAMADDQKLIETYQKAANKGMGLVVMKTQAGVSWWRAQYQRDEAVRGTLNHTAMLKWALRHEIFATAVPGYTTFEHMQEDFSVAYGLEYTQEEQQFLNDKEVKYASGFCRQCEQCLPSCAKGVDIPSLMRTAMYAYQYNNMEHAAATYQTIAQQQNLTQCRTCSSCTAACAHTVPIAQKINALNVLNFA